MEITLFALRVLLAAALYVFLGAVLWVLLRELRQPVVARSEAPASQLTALLEDGSPNHLYTIQSAAWIGRDPNCLICTDDEFASLRHAQVLWRVEDQTWYAEDNLSRNGTFVNGERITRAALKDGDVIRVGRTGFRFEMSRDN
jgi:pSer/pThr/pTyr-binding forkhead associated (FHA) protein